MAMIIMAISIKSPCRILIRGMSGLLAKRNPEVLYFVKTEKPVVALTIDDGPDKETTDLILKTLKLNNAKATFLIITDNIAGNEKLMERIVSEGHEIGNHLTKDERSASLPSHVFENRLKEAHLTLLRYASTIRWFRPGSGRFNRDMLRIIKRYDYRCALGDIYPYDAHVPCSWFAAKYIISCVEPRSIVVLHDRGSRGKRTARTLVEVLPALNRRGLRIVTLSELAG